MIDVKVKKLNPKAQLPLRGTPFSAGYDVFSCVPEKMVLKPQETVAIPTGLSFEPPNGYHFKVESRSGTAVRNSIGVLCGVIDQDYRGELKIVLFNNSLTHEFVVEDGQKIAQLIFVKTETVEFSETEELSNTVRAEGGFGSTGV